MISRSTKEKLLTPRDVLAILPVSRPTLHRFLVSRQLAHYKFGRRIFVRPADLRAFMEARHVR